MKSLKKVLSVIIAFILAFGCFAFTAQADMTDDEFSAHLRNMGFPDSYVTRLSELHVSHPNWTFEPVMITDLNSSYTWSYCLSNEVSPENRNLVGKSSTYAAYRRNTNSYDSGWYPASKATISFFMDPRNFLTEGTIFMFEDLTFTEGAYSVETVDAVFHGTFMYNSVIPDAGNSLTYAQYIYHLGSAYNVNPMFLAARLRLEKGVDGNTKPLLTGNCGTVLYNYYSSGTNGAPSSGYSYSSLTQYNGYYNYFNIGAAGNGYFNIYLNAMKEAKEGGWTTHMAALEGGVAKLKTKYIDDYQDTLYFQKFNVDPRSSRNFWGQYMQNISAIWTESISVYDSYIDYSLINNAFHFKIPVFSGMSSSPQSDPGTLYTEKHSYHNMMDAPSGATPLHMQAIRATQTVDFASSTIFNLQGWSVHTTSRYTYAYSVDGGPWIHLANSYREDVQNAYPSYSHASFNAFNGAIDMGLYGLGVHTLRIRGEFDNGSSYPVASITLNCKADGVKLNSNTYNISYTANDKTVKGVPEGSTVQQLASHFGYPCRVLDSKGNIVSSTDILKTGYKIEICFTNTVVDSAIVIVYGDVTCDGKVTAKDLIKAKKLTVGGTSGHFSEAVDFDGNDVISDSELTTLAKYLAAK